MKNLDKIIAASKMGYSSLLALDGWGDGKVIGLRKFLSNESYFVLAIFGDEEMPYEFYTSSVENMKITGYLYVGHLFGEPVIPEGQRFRLKATGDIFKEPGTHEKGEGFAYLLDYERTDLSELEPVFE